MPLIFMYILLYRQLLQFVMENCLTLAMTQACRYLREPSLPPRDKQFLKRELGTELVSRVVDWLADLYVSV